jgi:triphosphoribosyl-dephospho-CoA synthase
MKTGKRIARLAHLACLLEACAPKPGNVNRHYDFTDSSLEDFLLSAEAIVPAFENAAHKGIGHIIWQAVVDTRRWVRSNTNLGMILLLAPLVKACLTDSDIAGSDPVRQKGVEHVRERLSALLKSLTVEDARLAFTAIRLAQPSGLGRVSQADIAEEPSVTLLQAMALARDRDAVAREYVTDFEITFETGLPALKEALSRGERFFNAIVHSFLTILSQVPDTLIARKKGQDAARQVSNWSGRVLLEGGIFTPLGRERLAEMDRGLRDTTHSLNPGTTADLTAAAVFLALLEVPPHP